MLQWYRVRPIRGTQSVGKNRAALYSSESTVQRHRAVKVGSQPIIGKLKQREQKNWFHSLCKRYKKATYKDYKVSGRRVKSINKQSRQKLTPEGWLLKAKRLIHNC